ncbi:MAG: methyltransferase domain-containing protein [Candidatus Micrarchaeota archaeon]
MLDKRTFEKLKRGPQVVVLKDAAMIVGLAGIGSGDKIVEAGSGSGFLAIFLANVVGKDGKVYSYEWREDFHKLAAKNVAKVGFDKIVELKQKSIFDGIDEMNVDAVILDLADSEKAVSHAFNSLKGNGVLVGFHPNVEQIKKFTDACKIAGFSEAEVIEVIVRDWKVRDIGCRPFNQGLVHTAFLSFQHKPSEPQSL